MDRLTALSRGMQLMFLGGLLLLIVSFFRWQEIEVEALGISEGVNAWHGWGVLAGLLTIALLVWLAVRAFATDIELPLSDNLAAGVLGALIVLTTLLKVLVDNEFRTAWAWFGLLFAALIAVGAWLQVSAGGGMETVRGDSGAPMSPPQAPPSSEAAPPPPPAQAPPSSEAAPPPPPSTDEP